MERKIFVIIVLATFPKKKHFVLNTLSNKIKCVCVPKKKNIFLSFLLKKWAREAVKSSTLVSDASAELSVYFAAVSVSVPFSSSSASLSSPSTTTTINMSASITTPSLPSTRLTKLSFSPPAETSATRTTCCQFRPRAQRRP